jgi:hypothetical protein
MLMKIHSASRWRRMHPPLKRRELPAPVTVKQTGRLTQWKRAAHAGRPSKALGRSGQAADSMSHRVRGMPRIDITMRMCVRMYSVNMLLPPQEPKALRHIIP